MGRKRGDDAQNSLSDGYESSEKAVAGVRTDAQRRAIRDEQDRRARIRKKALDLLLSNFKLSKAAQSNSEGRWDLCPACTAIDFEKIFFASDLWASLAECIDRCGIIPGAGVPVYVLSGLSAAMIDSPCSLCKILATMAYEPEAEELEDEETSRRWHLRAMSIGYDDQRALYLTEHWEDGYHSDPSLWQASMRRGRLLPSITTRNPANPHKQLSWGAHVWKEHVDFTRVRYLLDDCRLHHTNKCSEGLPRRPVNARVIDCLEMAVVPLDPNMEYVALSYVWGPQPDTTTHIDSLSIDGQKRHKKLQWALPKRLPRTIEDSIKAVKALGLRYIWIDRYCIQQVHASDKRQQISQMANIYGRAVATICALGAHDDCGLPGVSSLRERNHFRAHNGITVVKTATAGRIQSLLEVSVWSTRGWTYQETFLSHRCLFFTSEDVFMICRESCTSEGVIHPRDDESSKLVRIAPKRLLPLDHVPTIGENEEIHLSFEDHVKEYQRRTLKYESDRLFAFEGLLQSQKLSTIVGVPIMEVPKSVHDNGDGAIQFGFAHGLAWRNIKWLPGHRSRRNYIAKFPSWSWLSRTGVKTEFQYYLRNVGRNWDTEEFLSIPRGMAHKIIYCADIGVADKNAATETIAHFINHQRNSVPKTIRHLHLSSVVVQWSQGGRAWKHELSFLAYIHLDTYPGTKPPYWFDISTSSLSAEGHLIGQLLVDDPKDSIPAGGLAILLFATGLVDRSYTRGAGRSYYGEIQTYWLAVRDVGGGRYRREGLIEGTGIVREDAAVRMAHGRMEVESHRASIVLD